LVVALAYTHQRQLLQPLEEFTMTTISPVEHALQETMHRFESALLTPVIGGELKAWITGVREAAATFGLDWTRYLRSVLHVQYDEISKVDPELLSQVDQMVQADELLLEDYARFHELLQELAARAARVASHESRLEESRHELERAGIDLVVRIKKQQTAASTWLSEAHYRDRGVAD
jgi:hypothetical protein